MKKNKFIILFIFISYSIFSQDNSNIIEDLTVDTEYQDDRLFFNEVTKFDKKGLKGWVIDFPQNEYTIQGYTLSNLIEDANGITFTLSKKNIRLKISLIREIKYDNLLQTLDKIEKTLNMGEEFIDKRGYGIIKINYADINFSDNNVIFISFRFTKLLLNINKLTYSTLDLTRIIEEDSRFIYYKNEDVFTYTVKIPKIKNTTGIGDSFAGWSYYLEKLYLFFEKQFFKNNRDIQLIIYNTQTNIDKINIIPDRQLSDNSIGMMVHGSYFDNKLNLKFLAFGKVRNFGYDEWLYKPFGIIFAGGLFGEADFAYLLGKVNSFDTFNIFYFFNYGVTLQFGFNIGIPVFSQEMIAGKKTWLFDQELLKIGYEMFFDVNIAYFLNNNYFLNIQPLFVVYLFPLSGAKLDFFVGGAILYFLKNNELTDQKNNFCFGMRLTFEYILRKVELRKKVRTKDIYK